MITDKILMPEWEKIHLGDMNRDDLFRHFMFLGETGSGKTVSGVLPICRLAFGSQYQFGDIPASGLVVDPKGELGDHIARMLGEDAGRRMIRIMRGAQSQVLWQFDGSSLEGRDGTSIMEELMMFADSYQGQKESHHDHFWISGSSQLISALIDIDLALFRHGNGGVENIEIFWRQFYMLIDAMSGDNAPLGRLYEMIKTKNIVSEKLDELLKELGISSECDLTYRKENYLHHFYHLIAASSYYGCETLKIEGVRTILKLSSGSEIFHRFWGLFVAFVESFSIGGHKVFRKQGVFFRQYSYMAVDTYSSFHAVFSSLVHEFMDREFYSRISVNPFECPDNFLPMDEIIARGKIVVYEPGVVTKVSATVGKVIKACFFKKLLSSERLNNPLVRPFFYICDEFQRFITHDEESGEQSFLDRCRAYRVSCVLATQSLASLRYAFPDEKGSQAVNILITNTGTKLFFRTTDCSTADTLSHLIPEPHRQDRPHVVRVRPPSTLKPGECYFVLVNGSSGRGQVQSLLAA